MRWRAAASSPRACDLVYVADDAKIGYPVVRIVSPPDMQFHPWLAGMRHAMELLLTGDSISGAEAAECGLANHAFPADELEARVLEQSPSASRRSRPTSSSSTSARSTARWT